MQHIASGMAARLHHRGPDSSGSWVDAKAGIAFGHARLSILDLSSAGHQPMSSASGRFWLTFNGEIYNHLALRCRLETEGAAPNWLGHSDTETLLACIEAWGVEATLENLTGMFAFGLWDRQKRSLVLARDRIGEKPLYYGWAGRALVFASELKAFQAHPGFSPQVDRGAITLLLRYNYIPTPFSIFTGIHKLLPGCWLEVCDLTRELPDPQPYWSLSTIVEAGGNNRFQGREADAADELERLLTDVISSQIVSDVPLGAFLSGGVDSSVIVALMQKQSDDRIRTFSIGFKEARFNEAGYAKAVAGHLGSNHTELYFSERDALDVVPGLPQIFDEPFGDSSQLPTILLSKLTREQVTVAMSGDGADELFGGYNRHIWAPQTWNKVAWLPQNLRRTLGFMLQQVNGGSARALDPVFAFLSRRFGFPVTLRDKLSKLGQSIRHSGSFADFYLELVSEWANPAAVVIGAREPETQLTERSHWPVLKTPEEQTMALDLMTYLPDDIMAKVDRSAMAASLETRAPFLDHSVVEFAWQLPLAMKINGNLGKSVLRQVLYRHVPRELIERPKQGFAMPMDDWLRTSLREWAEDLLSERRLKAGGFFEVEPIRLAWESHLSRKCQNGQRLWSVLMFQAWV